MQDDVQSRELRARTTFDRGDHAGGIQASLDLLSDMEGARRDGTPFYSEADVRYRLAGMMGEVGDPRAARELTQAAALFHERGDPLGEYRASIRMAGVEGASEANALYWVDRAARAAERAGDPEAMRSALACRGELLCAFGRFEKGLEALRSATGMPGGDAHRVSLAEAQLRAGQTEAAMATLTSALAELDAGSSPDASRELRLRVLLADALRASGRRREALEQLKEAAGHVDRLDDEGERALIFNHLGSALLEAGDPGGAAEALERGLDHARAAVPVRPGLLSALYTTLGSALASIGSEEGAVRALSAAVEKARDAGALESEAGARAMLANVAAKMGAEDEARKQYEEARGIARRLENARLEAVCLDSLGQLEARAGNPAAAIDLHARAEELHAKAGDFTGQHTDLLNRVQAHLLLDDVEGARRALDAAEAVGHRRLDSVPWESGLMKGQVLSREGSWNEADAAFETAIAELEAQRDEMMTPEEQRRWAAGRVEAFEIAAACAFEAGDALAALRYLEGNRARFLEEVSERRRRLPTELSAPERRAYIRAMDRLAELRWRRRTRPEAPDPELEIELRTAEEAWRRLDSRVQSLKPGGPTPVGRPDPREVAGTLSPGEAAVALHVTPDWTGVACVGRSRDGSVWSSCGLRPELTLDELSRWVLGRDGSGEVTEGSSWADLSILDIPDREALVASTCERLGQVLWPLIETVVDGRADALVLMPGRGLTVLPLHAAPTPGGTLALEKWSIRYAPSLAILSLMSESGSDVCGPSLGLAVDPTGDLPLAELEAVAVTAEWGHPVPARLSRSEADRDAVLALFGAVDVLHFAGHGSFEPNDPLQSQLRCWPGDASGSVTLRMLLEDVHERPARVVILSACETGKVLANDPVNDQLGLPGGLLVGGTRAVLATFWTVSDLAACLVVSRCVSLWREGAQPLEQALARSQRWLRTEATVGRILEWLDGLFPGGEMPAAIQTIRRELDRFDHGTLLFDGPLHWAPFHVTGRSILAPGAQRARERLESG